MKKFFSFILLFLIVSLAVVSCVSRKPPEPVIIEKTKTITEIVKDTVYQVEADSSFYSAYVECVNGKAFLVNNENLSHYISEAKKEKPPQQIAGQFLEVPKVKLENGLLTVSCEKRAQELFKQWREKYISENSKEIQPPVYIEKPLTWIQKALMWFGAISLIGCAFILILFFKK